MARGYLACWNGIPPLVFRFQFNPETLTERKAYKYREVENFGNWAFDKTSAALQADQPWYVKLATVPGGALDDIKEIGPQLVRTHPLEATCGDQRSFALDFVLDGQVRNEGATSEVGNPYEGDIAPDLALLRSFVNPGLDTGSLMEWISSGFEKTFAPPPCTLIYGGINADCVMESLGIKITRFNADTSPSRAEISISLKQQTQAFTPLVEIIERYVNVGRTFARPGFGDDYVNVLPGASLVKHIFDL
jgi:Contractile injection system tube protein